MFDRWKVFEDFIGNGSLASTWFSEDEHKFAIAALFCGVVVSGHCHSRETDIGGDAKAVVVLAPAEECCSRRMGLAY